MDSTLLVETFPTRAAWLAARNGATTIGASDAAKVLGIGPYDCWSFWARKRDADVVEAEDTVATRRGKHMESAVLGFYGDESGNDVIQPGAYFGQPGHLVTLANINFPWLRESPDAFARDCEGELGHVEAKSAADGTTWTREKGIVIDRWEKGSESLLPPHYAIQAYVQLAVTELPWNDVCVLLMKSEPELRWVRLLRDESTQSAIVKALAAWREKHLIQGEPPPIDGSEACNRYLARHFTPAEKRAPRIATPEEARKMRRIDRRRTYIAAAKKQIDVYTNELVVSAGAEKLVIRDEKNSPYGQVQYVAPRTTIDASKLEQEFPEAYKACSRTSKPSAWFATYKFEEKSK